MFYRSQDPSAPHGLINSCDVPRSIFWITSQDTGGIANAAPYSFSGAVAYKPPQVFFAATGLKNGKEANSVANVRATGEFVVNFPTYDSRELMNATSAAVPSEVDEMELAGLEKVASTLVTPPGIAISPIRLECRLRQIVVLAGDDNTLVVGEVLGYHIRGEFINDGAVDWTAYRPIARMGRADAYTVVEHVFHMSRPG